MIGPKVTAKLLFLRQIFRGRKLLNLAVKEIQMALGQSRLFYLPNKLTIDIGNVCNLKCPLCPTGRGDTSAARGFMQLGTYTKIIDYFAPYLTNLQLHNWGEPLLHKNLVEMVQYAKARRVPVSFSTNLTLLDRQKAEALMATRVEKIFISLDAAHPESYARYRVGGDFKSVINNIRELVEARTKIGNEYTRLKVLFHVFKHNEHELADIDELVRRLGVELVVDRMRPDMGKEITETARMAIDRDREWIPDDPRYRPFDMETKEKKGPTTCRDLWSTSVINWNGDVLPCCSVYGDQHSFGSILKEPFRAIWNNQKYVAARREVRGRLDDSRTICHTCRISGFRHF